LSTPPDFETFKKDNPHLTKFWPYLEVLKKESERGKVLVSCGFLEEQLKEVLLAFMRDTTQSVDLVDGGNAPLGTFSARIAATYSLGLIREREHHDLNLIRRIRNDFAHSIETSFETRSVVDRCRELVMKAPDYTHHELGEIKLPASGQFQTAAVALIMKFTTRPHYVRERRKIDDAWPY
jgi:mannitol operon repressor